MKNHNDTYGFPSGDRVIREVAEALREAYPGDMVYRVGGDEFIVILSSGELRQVKMPESTVIRYSIVSIALPEGRGWSLEDSGAIRLYLGRGLDEARPEGTSLIYKGEPLSLLPAKPSLWVRVKSALRSAPDKGKPAHR